MNDAPRQSVTAKELLVFYAKLAGLIAGLTAFGFLIYWLRKSL